MSNLPVEVLSTQEVERLLAHADRADVHGLRDAALLGTLYYAAATAGEACALNLGDVDLEQRVLRMRGDEGGLRRVPIEDELLELLTRYIQEARRLILAHGAPAGLETPALFVTNRGHRVRVQDARQILGANVKGSGLESAVNLNTLRLSRAWHLREAGSSPESIQRLLGTASRSGRRVF